MGNCVGAGNPEDREAKSRSSAIDRQLREDRKEYENTIKILLLGKSVFSNQSALFEQLAVYMLPCVLQNVMHGYSIKYPLHYLKTHIHLNL